MSAQNFADVTSIALTGGGWLMAAADNLEAGTVMIVTGTVITVISLVWSRVVKPIYIDWRTINIDLDTKSNQVLRMSVEDHVKRATVELSAKVDLLDHRITDLTAKLDNWAAKITDYALPAEDHRQKD